MCQWGTEQVWVWANPVGNSWRTTYDIHNTYHSMLKNLDGQIGLSKYARSGGWNDPDMLEVGNALMTREEYQSHFALWAVLKAPLLMGNNVEGMTRETLDILGNEEVIAVNQDPLGHQGDLMWDERGDGFHRQVWGGPLSDNRFVFLCFNRGDSFYRFNLDLNTLIPTVTPVSAREIIGLRDVPIEKGFIVSDELNQHASAMFVVKYEQ